MSDDHTPKIPDVPMDVAEWAYGAEVVGADEVPAEHQERLTAAFALADAQAAQRLAAVTAADLDEARDDLAIVRRLLEAAERRAQAADDRARSVERRLAAVEARSAPAPREQKARSFAAKKRIKKRATSSYALRKQNKLARRRYLEKLIADGVIDLDELDEVVTRQRREQG